MAAKKVIWPETVTSGTELGRLLPTYQANKTMAYLLGRIGRPHCYTAGGLLAVTEAVGVDELVVEVPGLGKVGEAALCEVINRLQELGVEPAVELLPQPPAPSEEMSVEKLPGLDSTTLQVLHHHRLNIVGDILRRLAQSGLPGLADILHSEDMAKAIRAALEEAGCRVLIPEEVTVDDLGLGPKLTARLLARGFTTVAAVLALTPRGLAHKLDVGLRDLIPIYDAIEAKGFPVPEVPEVSAPPSRETPVEDLLGFDLTTLSILHYRELGTAGAILDLLETEGLSSLKALLGEETAMLICFLLREAGYSVPEVTLEVDPRP